VRHITFGMYSLFCQSWNLDFSKIIADLKASKFTGLSLHLNSPWGQHPDQPDFWWPYDGDSFTLTAKNKPKYKRLFEFVDLLFANDLDLELCLLDQYHTRGWKTPLRVHPFRDNNVGVSWDVSAKPLYDSWMGGSAFSWLKWTAVNESALQFQFSLVGGIGKGLSVYHNSVIRAIKQAWDKHPDSKSLLLVKGFNETRAYIDSNGHTNASKSLGDRAEPYAFIRDLWEAAGFAVGPRFKHVIDYGASPFDGPHHMTAMKSEYQWCRKSVVRAMLEIHSVGEEHSVSEYLGQHDEKLE